MPGETNIFGLLSQELIDNYDPEIHGGFQLGHLVAQVLYKTLGEHDLDLPAITTHLRDTITDNDPEFWQGMWQGSTSYLIDRLSQQTNVVAEEVEETTVSVEKLAWEEVFPRLVDLYRPMNFQYAALRGSQLAADIFDAENSTLITLDGTRVTHVIENGEILQNFEYDLSEDSGNSLTALALKRGETIITSISELMLKNPPLAERAKTLELSGFEIEDDTTIVAIPVFHPTARGSKRESVGAILLTLPEAMGVNEAQTLLQEHRDDIDLTTFGVALAEHVGMARQGLEKAELVRLSLQSLMHDFGTALNLLGFLDTYSQLYDFAGDYDETTAIRLIGVLKSELPGLTANVRTLRRIQKEVFRIIDTGDINLILKPHVLSELTGDLKKQLDNLVKASNTNGVHVSIDEPLALDNKFQVDVHDTSLYRILQNLIDNAVKYTPEDKDNPVVNVDWIVADGEFIIEVTDQGVGISDRDIQRIFEASYRVGEVQSTLGWGIGLSGTKLLTEQMKGKIEVESVKGVGSTFRVKLPLRDINSTE